MEYTQVLESAGGNLLTLVCVTVMYVVYKRCLTCRSECHTKMFECSTEQQRQRKREKKIDIVCSALEKHGRQTLRNSSDMILNVRDEGEEDQI